MTITEEFEVERPGLTKLAERILNDHAEAEDVTQLAWLRLHRAAQAPDFEFDSLPAWLTTWRTAARAPTT